MVDEKVFTSETRALLPMMYRISMSMLHVEADAQDAMQQALTKAWEKRTAVDADFFRAWLMKIMINECRNIHRHRKRIVPVEYVEHADALDTISVELADAVGSLPEKLRVPFLLKYLALYKEKEIASILSLPQSTIKNRLHKARLLLRDALSDWEVTFK